MTEYVSTIIHLNTVRSLSADVCQANLIPSLN